MAGFAEAVKIFLLDGILFALFVAELCFHHLPKILHEIFGVAFALMIVVHVWKSRRRLTALTKNFTPRKIFSLTTDAALTVCATFTAATGVCMSNYLFAVSAELHRNMTLHQLHVAAPYAMMILLGVHVGLHWRELHARLTRLIGEKIFNALLMLMSALGGLGLSMNRVDDRLLMKHIFATPATELPAVIFALMIVGGVIFFAMITSLLDKFFGRSFK